MNPIIQIREKHEISRDEFAHMAGISYATLFNSEKSYPNKLNNKILRVVKALGYNPGEIQKKYINDRTKRQQDLLKHYAK